MSSSTIRVGVRYRLVYGLHTVATSMYLVQLQYCTHKLLRLAQLLFPFTSTWYPAAEPAAGHQHVVYCTPCCRSVRTVRKIYTVTCYWYALYITCWYLLVQNALSCVCRQPPRDRRGPVNDGLKNAKPQLNFSKPGSSTRHARRDREWDRASTCSP